jgi:release factor glutamine methyltransferase
LGKIWTVLEILHWGEDYFRKHSISSPRLTMELLLCNILNCQRIDLYLNYDRPLLSEELDKLHNYIILVTKSVPLQYIFGKTQFYGMELLIDNRALIPRQETEQLVKIAIEFLENSNVNQIQIMDIGTGSGCLAIAIAYHFQKSEKKCIIDAIDDSSEALELAKENAQKYNINNIKFHLLDILQTNISLEKYNCIVSNPPYIPFKNYKTLDRQIRDYEPQSSLTDFADGLTFYKKYKELIETMQTGAIMVLEIDGSNTNDLLEIFIDSNCKIEIFKDIAGIDRILTLQK